MTSIEAKRQILQSQPGKKYHFNNDSADMINTAFAAFMATNHPEVRFDEIDGYAMAHAAAATKGA